MAAGQFSLLRRFSVRSARPLPSDHGLGTVALETTDLTVYRSNTK